MSTTPAPTETLAESLYPDVCKQVRVELRNAGRIHGSRIRDLFVAYGRGMCADSGPVERVITDLGLVPETPDAPCMTPSQRAWYGIQRLRKHPGFAPGYKEHFWLTCPVVQSLQGG